MATSPTGKGLTAAAEFLADDSRLRAVALRLDELEREFVELKARVERLRAEHIAFGGQTDPPSQDTSDPGPSTEPATVTPARHGAKCPMD